MPKPSLSDLQAILDRIDADLGKHAAPVQRERPDVLAGCFPDQLAFIRDASPFRFAICTRRAAKTYSVGLDFINDSLDHPRANYLFLGLVREETKRIFWKDVLKDIDLRYGLNAKFNESDLCMTMPNGAVIYLGAADQNEKERRKLLGARYRKVCIDEAQAWTVDLRDLVYGVLSPAVTDLRGQITLTGTPGNLYTGFFKEVTNGCSARGIGPPEIREPGWQGFAWTTDKNPYVAAQWKARIEGLVAANPRVVETPWFRNNYLGEWVVDVDGLVYKFDAARNTFGELPLLTDPRGAWHFVLGVDLGFFPDPSAFVLACYHDFDPCLYLLRSWKEWRMDITDVANRVKLFEEEVRVQYGADIEFFVIDGANAQAVAEMRRRHQLDLLPADKRGKEDFIELMNSEFIFANIKVSPRGCSEGVLNSGTKSDSLGLIEEYQGLIWDPRVPKGKPRKEHVACQNHLADAALYAWRFCYQYLSKAPPALPPQVGSHEWLQAEAERMREEAEAQMRERLGDPEEPVGLTEWFDRRDPLLQ